MNNNIIQIKRGEGHPNTVLQPYEPGIDISDNNHLYIGGLLNDQGETTNAQEVKVGSAGFAMGLILKEGEGYGETFPSNPKEGQVFFQLLTE